MRYVFASIFCILSASALADITYDSFNAYYSQLKGGIFSNALEEPADKYAIEGEHGMCGEDDACQDRFGKLGSKNVKLTFSSTKGVFEFNGRHFRFGDARQLGAENNSSSEIPLYGVSAYLAKKEKKHPDMACIEGYYMGSGRFKVSEIFLILNPLGPEKQTEFYRLPGLHSSCLAIRENSEHSIIYPSNSYFPQGDENKSTELIMSWQFIENGATHSLGRETKLRFIEPGNPFKFSAP